MVSSSRPKRLQHPLTRFLGYQLRRAASFMQADLAARIADLGLTIVEMSTLLVIEANPGITQSEIGRLIAIKRANMAPLTAGLVARSLVVAKPVDKRSSGLALTANGRRMVEKIHQRVAENEELLFRDVPAAQRDEIVELVRLIWSSDEKSRT